MASILIPAYVYANGRAANFSSQTTGPYKITLGTIPPSPAIGDLHITIAVTEVTSDMPIFDVGIKVTLFGPGGLASKDPIMAEPDNNDPRFQDVSSSVDIEGIWIINVSVEGAAGNGSANFPVEVKNTNPLLGIATLLALIGILTTLGLSIRASLVNRKKPRLEKTQG